VVNTWSIGNNPQLLSNGNFLDAAQDDPNSNKGWKELDWDGNVVWEYYETREGYAPHHDWAKIFNPKLKEDTFMYIANKTVTEEEAIAAGCDPEDGPYEEAQMDAVVEVDREGNIIWEWRFIDHVIRTLIQPRQTMSARGKQSRIFRAGSISICPGDRSGKTGCTAIRWTITRSWIRSSSILSRASSM
jgi:hypothetical protein